MSNTANRPTVTKPRRLSPRETAPDVFALHALERRMQARMMLEYAARKYAEAMSGRAFY